MTTTTKPAVIVHPKATTWSGPTSNPSDWSAFVPERVTDKSVYRLRPNLARRALDRVEKARVVGWYPDLATAEAALAAAVARFAEESQAVADAEAAQAALEEEQRAALLPLKLAATDARRRRALAAREAASASATPAPDA
jgi:hypothetical protein